MKFRPLSIYLLGLSIFIVAVSYGYFTYYQPNEEEAKYNNDYAASLQDVGADYSKAVDRVHSAYKLVTQAQQQWADIVATRTPPDNVADGGIDLQVNGWQLPGDARSFRNSIQIAVNKQIQAGGIKLPNGGPTVPGFGETQDEVLKNLNYPAPYAFPVEIVEIPGVTVQGTYDQIMANYKAWGTMPHYVAMPDGLQLSGTSPLLTGTYNVIILGYLKAKSLYPPQPDTALGGK